MVHGTRSDCGIPAHPGAVLSGARGRLGLDDHTRPGEVRVAGPGAARRSAEPRQAQRAYELGGTALVEATLRRTVESKGNATEIEVPGEISLDDALVARAHGGSAPSGARAGSPFEVGLRFDPSDRDHGSPPMLQLVPPRGEVDTRIWLNTIAQRLLSSSDEIRAAGSGSVSMLQAHDRAISELSYAKDRFTTGLKPGETLYIKRGFETPSGSKEFLWLVVTRWSGNRLIAQVAKEPRELPELRLGQTITVEEASIFDWMIALPHDRSEGGYTSHVAVQEGLG